MKQKKSDTPDRLDTALVRMSHKAITAIAEAIHKALTDAEKGKDPLFAQSDHHPRKKVEMILKRGYIEATAIIEDEFPEDEDNSDAEAIIAAGAAMAAGSRRQVVEAAATGGAEAQRILTEAIKNPIIVTNTPNFRRFESPSHYYERTVSKAIEDVLSGDITHEKAVKTAVRELTRSGLRWVNYQSGWANRTNVAVRRAITTEITHAVAEKAFRDAQSLGTKYYEVEYHDAARPEHAEWQGKVYTEEELYDICGLGEVTGLCGANCYHYFYPFDPEKSERLYTDDFLAQKLKESRQTKVYDGTHYTPYQAKQQMRQMESAMRIQREKIDILNKCGMDAITDRAKYSAQRRLYEQFAGAMGQKTDWRRVYQDGLGRV